MIPHSHEISKSHTAPRDLVFAAVGDKIQQFDRVADGERTDLQDQTRCSGTSSPDLLKKVQDLEECAGIHSRRSGASAPMLRSPSPVDPQGDRSARHPQDMPEADGEWENCIKGCGRGKVNPASVELDRSLGSSASATNRGIRLWEPTPSNIASAARHDAAARDAGYDARQGLGPKHSVEVGTGTEDQDITASFLTGHTVEEGTETDACMEGDRVSGASHREPDGVGTKTPLKVGSGRRKEDPKSTPSETGAGESNVSSCWKKRSHVPALGVDTSRGLSNKKKSERVIVEV